LDGFPAQRRLQHYRTTGYRRVILHQGITISSYRTVCKNFNHTVRQEKEQGIKPSGVRYEATVEAQQIGATLSANTEKILSENHFQQNGHPTDKAAIKRLKKAQKRHQTSPAKLKKAYEEIEAEANENILPMLKFEDLRPDDYENAKVTTYIGLDDVCNKRQKTHRQTDLKASADNTNSRKGGKKVYKKRKQLYHTVAKIFTPTQSYTLTAPKIGMLWATLIAFLLHNNCLRTLWIGLVDGQRSLHDFLLQRLRWRHCRLLLDWYHLRKKIHGQMYMGLKTNDHRDAVLLNIEQLLWYGLIDTAIEQINQIPENLIKDQDRLRILIGYFERNRTLIPNYALRKKLGLVLSSNRVEKENDFIVSARQKHNGMSWTRQGSDALALISANQRNKELDNWLIKDELQFKFAA